ncbi:MAG: energy transducer TonB [Myxococcota bacterium]|jgi:protein TonB|nr:hypothetical protein [Deltaproteobacteria bacterium]MCP4241342.1 energy transducer TonB [bacterium]MDP6075845.1 energy transducer TonB [Myxococcota bacterium]MDP6244335.1 energy transducer TonB [Myxococcota bacterium]MDP7075133.1 energy transducer TonB [Myxococcota bacterium]
MNLRFPIATAAAVCVTFFLFWAMQALVSVQGQLSDAVRSPSVDFIRLKRDTTPETKKREKPKREKPEQPPPPPDISMSKASLNPGEGVGGIVPDIDPTGALDVTGAGADRDVVPLVRIEPDYPMRARQRGIEGWVLLEFTITKVGTIKDPKVLSSHPGTIFDRSALNAVRKWKYNPSIKNGAAVARSGVRVRLDFEMDR